MMLLGSSQKLLRLCSVSASSSLQALAHGNVVALLNALIARALLIAMAVTAALMFLQDG